jgi:hypothetical protein
MGRNRSRTRALIISSVAFGVWLKGRCPHPFGNHKVQSTRVRNRMPRVRAAFRPGYHARPSQPLSQGQGQPPKPRLQALQQQGAEPGAKGDRPTYCIYETRAGKCRVRECAYEHEGAPEFWKERRKLGKLKKKQQAAAAAAGGGGVRRRWAVRSLG